MAAPSRMRKLTVIASVVTGLLVLAAGAAHAQNANPVASSDVYDGFETPELSPVWDTSKFEPGAVTMQSDIVRAGQHAARIILHRGDYYEAGADGDPPTERAELMESRRLISREGVPYEYSFSLFLPTDFPLVPTRLVIAQWKQYCPGNGACSNDSPVVAVRYIGGVLQITQTLRREGKTRLLQTKEDLRGKWTDFKFRIRFATDTTGRVQTWMDGKPVLDYRGISANAEDGASGYPNPSVFYFKMGLYRDEMAEPMTLYIDEYGKRELADEASP